LRVGSIDFWGAAPNTPGGLSEGKWVPPPEAAHSFVPLAYTGIALDPSTELANSLEELAHRAREPHLVATATAARYRTVSLGPVIVLDVLVEPCHTAPRFAQVDTARRCLVSRSFLDHLENCPA
jgi:hypothetical protein